MTWAWSLTTRLLADGDAGRGELIDFFEEPRRVDDDAVADDRRDAGLEDAGRQERELEGAVAPDDGVAGVGAAVVADDEVVSSARRSTIFPLASSPHCRPTTQVQLIPRPTKKARAGSPGLLASDPVRPSS